MDEDQAYQASIEEFYSDVGPTEEEVGALLDESLGPRGPHMLFDMAAEAGMGIGDLVLDAGCGEGEQMAELVRRFGCRAVGVELVAANLARRGANVGTEEGASTANHMRFVQADVQRLPFAEASFDFVWSRDMLIHVPDLPAALRECRRVLKVGGRMLVLQMFATARLSDAEADRLWPPLAAVARNADPAFFEESARAAGWRLGHVEHVRSQWREFGEESGPGKTSRQLLHVARMLRDPDRYVAAMGRGEYEAALADSLWGVYQMIGKLSFRVYVLEGG
jgi:SAM-dependent methyltransferase